MAINFNTNPYYDDFDETKGYHRILFRPGYAVQARELTQLQTQLQDQINKFGDHIFVNGTVVIGGGRTFENDLTSVKIETTFAGQTVNPANFADKVIIGQTSGAEAIIKKSIGATGSDPITFIISFTAGGQFIAGESVETSDGVFSATIQNTNPFNNAMLFSVDAGVFFVDGKFVYTESQSVAVDKYSNISSKNIGFLVQESIVDSDEDEELLDRAQGSPNFSAPGADRYKVSLELSSKDLTTETDNFIEIARVVDGILIVNREKTIYSELGKELARRTFDESGDYTVKRWPIQILDHQSNTPDADKFTVALDPGKGYVKGYEYETISQEFLALDRARVTDQASLVDTSTAYGNYVYVKTFLTSTGGSYPKTTSPTTIANNTDTANLYDGGTLIGTCRIRYMKHLDGTGSGVNAIYRLYLWDINITASNKSFGDVTQIADSNWSAQIDNLSKYTSDGVTFGDTILGGANSPGLVFRLPNEYIETVRDENNVSVSQYKAQIKTQVSFSGGTTTFTLPQGQTFVSIGTLTDTQKYANFIISNPSGGTPINLSSGTTTINVTTAGNNIQTATITTSAITNGTTYMWVTVNVNNATEKTKALSPYKYKVFNGSLNTTLGGIDSLAASDIYDIVAIYNTGTTNPSSHVASNFSTTTGVINWSGFGGTETDVTDNYILDNGQTAEVYDHGGIILSGTAPNSAHNLVVVYRNFTHSGAGFFTVDSYNSIPYEDIPSFTDPSTGKVFNLRDCVDFRLRRTDNSSNYEGAFICDPQDTFDSSYRYYLSRIDKVIALPEQKFIIKQGIPALNPKVPADETNGMTIYAVLIPPYTSNLRDIQIKYIDNQRYTMKDIGKLEKRINNLEYYTQLSLLEKQAKDTSIPDSSNLEKFKNGFVVDAFTSADIFANAAVEGLWAQRRWGWWNAWFNGSNNWNIAAQNYNDNSIAMPDNIDFNAAIDPINQELRAPFSTEFHYFETGTLTNTERTGDNIGLQYTEAVAQQQPLASTYINVNPFNIVKFLGNINLEPSFDQWIDTVNLPAVNKVVDVQLPDAADRLVRNVTAVRSIGLLWRQTSTNTSVVTNEVSSSTTSLGSSVVDIQYVPFMRSRDVVGICTEFKPSSRLYGYMENQSIDQYLKPLTLVEIENHQGNLFDDSKGIYEALSIRTDHTLSSSEQGTAKTAIYTDPRTTDPTKRLLSIFDETVTPTVGQWIVGANGGYGQITAVTSYPLGSALIPDEYGNLGFVFDVPGNTFKTGERTIRLINNNTNDVEAQDSFGEAKYTAIGQIQTKQETILTTRTLQRQRTVTRTGFYYDPIAQTFNVDSAQYPEGMHLSSVDVFFRSKSNTVPVTMEIRRTVNGYPESQSTTIPYAVKTLRAEQVTTSANALAATRFEFPAIHLTPGEYAITLLSNSSSYEVYVAEIGKTILGGTTKIDKQPAAGSLFKSQNASTWEPDQNKDMKFTINRAEFALSGSAEFSIIDPVAIKNYHALFVNIASITPGSTNINWYAKAFDGTFHDNDWAPIDINQDIEYLRLLEIDAAAGAGNTPTLRLRAEMTTTDKYVSPIIDAASISVVTTENLINNDTTGETNPVGGNALAKYITKPITLADGFDASNLNVTLDINRPSATNVKVYFRTLAPGETTPITDKTWTEMDLDPTATILPSANSFEYPEHRFFPPNAFDSQGFGIPQDDPISERFQVFQIKILLLSQVQQFTPKLRDLRIIALDS